MSNEGDRLFSGIGSAPGVDYTRPPGLPAPAAPAGARLFEPIDYFGRPVWPLVTDLDLHQTRDHPVLTSQTPALQWWRSRDGGTPVVSQAARAADAIELPGSADAYIEVLHAATRLLTENRFRTPELLSVMESFALLQIELCEAMPHLQDGHAMKSAISTLAELYWIEGFVRDAEAILNRAATPNQASDAWNIRAIAREMRRET
jgi:hypothetical protein